MNDFENVTVTTGTILLTAEGYARLQVELERLTVEKRAEIAARIRESKEHGEFSEDNHELDEVKFEQAMVENRINELKAIFAAAMVIEPGMLGTDEVGVGNYVQVKDLDRGFDFEIRLVSSVEADPDKDYVSNESPMGLALVGAKKGDTVNFDAPAGKIRYQVLNIRK